MYKVPYQIPLVNVSRMCKSATTVSETANWLDDFGKLFYFPVCICLPQLQNGDDDTHSL